VAILVRKQSNPGIESTDVFLTQQVGVCFAGKIKTGVESRSYWQVFGLLAGTKELTRRMDLAVRRGVPRLAVID